MYSRSGACEVIDQNVLYCNTVLHDGACAKWFHYGCSELMEPQFEVVCKYNVL